MIMVLNSNNDRSEVSDIGIFSPERKVCISDLYNSFSDLEVEKNKKNSKKAIQIIENLKSLKNYYLCKLYEANDFKEFYSIVNNISEMLFDNGLKFYKLSLNGAFEKYKNINRRYLDVIVIDPDLSNISSNYTNDNSKEILSSKYKDIFNFIIEFNSKEASSNEIERFLLEIASGIKEKLDKLIELCIEVESKFYFDPFTFLGNKIYIDELLEDMPYGVRDFSVIYIDLNLKDIDGNCSFETSDKINQDFALILHEELNKLYKDGILKDKIVEGEAGYYGEGKIVICLPNINNEEAIAVANNILNKSKNNIYNSSGKVIGVGPFMGVSTNSTRFEGEGQELLRRSNYALDIAKNGDETNGNIVHIDNLTEDEKKHFSEFRVSKIYTSNSNIKKEVIDSLDDTIKFFVQEVNILLRDKKLTKIEAQHYCLEIIREVSSKTFKNIDEKF